MRFSPRASTIPILLMLILSSQVSADDNIFPQLMGRAATFSFDVHAPTQKDAEETASGLEQYYKRFISDLKYGGMLKKKPQVYIFKDRQEYVDNVSKLGYNVTHTGAIAVPRSARKAAAIYGFLSPDLVTRKLPHELTHLLFREFTAGLNVEAKIPLWLNEGMAGYEETGNDYRQAVAAALKSGRLIPLARIVSYADYPEAAEESILFYAESASIVEFLITEFGGTRFLSFSRKLVTGKKNLTEALSASFYPHVRNVDQLSAAWLECLSAKLAITQ